MLSGVIIMISLMLSGLPKNRKSLGISRTSSSALLLQYYYTAYDITTVAYACKTNYILTSDHLWQGRIGAVKVPFERAIDIDYQIDLDIADL